MHRSRHGQNNVSSAVCTFHCKRSKVSSLPVQHCRTVCKCPAFSCSRCHSASSPAQRRAVTTQHNTHTPAPASSITVALGCPQLEMSIFNVQWWCSENENRSSYASRNLSFFVKTWKPQMKYCCEILTRSASFISGIKHIVWHWANAFLVSAVTAWNSLPPHVRDAPSLLTFHRELKTELFRLSYPACWQSDIVCSLYCSTVHSNRLLFIADLRDIRSVASTAINTGGDDWGSERSVEGAQRWSTERMGYGERHHSPSQIWEFGGIATGKILNCNMQICSTITPNYMHSQHAIYNNENNCDKLWGHMRYFVPGWPNIAGDASPVALTPLHTLWFYHYDLLCTIQPIGCKSYTKRLTY